VTPAAATIPSSPRSSDNAGLTTTRSGGIRGPAMDHSRKTSATNAAGVARVGPDSPGRDHSAHNRSASLVSVTTRNMLGSLDDGASNVRRSHDTGREESNTLPTDKFDQLVQSAETMKVSLTPSRLKTFDVSLSAP
jgi:hypothetical protein